MVITDWSRHDCVERIAAAVAGETEVAVQHRHPGASDRALYEEGLRLRAALGPVPMFVNGRVDLAVALGAHLHLREDSLAVEEVRPLLRGRWISASWHAGTPARAVDLLLLSPVFAPNSKPGDAAPLGPAEFDRLAQSVTIPVFALGGIDAVRAATLEHAAGLAAIGHVMDAADPKAAVRALLTAHRRGPSR